MRMTWDQLKHLPVVTRSGDAVGYVAGFVFDPEGHTIIQYEVRRGTPLARRSLLVGSQQVVSISAERMTVDDNTVSSVSEKTQRVPSPEPTAPTLAATRKITAR